MKLEFTDEEQNETTSASAMYFTPFIYNILRVVQFQIHKMFQFWTVLINIFCSFYFYIKIDI